MRNTICALAILTGLAGPAHASSCMIPNSEDPQVMQLYWQCQKLERESQKLERERMPTSYSDCVNWAFSQNVDPYAIEKCHRLEDY